MSRAAAALLYVVGALVLTQTAWRLKRDVRELEQIANAADRFVDVSVRLITVRRDDAGRIQINDSRFSAVPGHEHEFGGVVDTQANPPHIVRSPENPRIWYCSEDQEQIILHPDTVPLGQLVYGSEGAGKTTALVMWTYLRWMEHLGQRWTPPADDTEDDRGEAVQETAVEGGISAPTGTRLGLVLAEIFKLYRSSWYSYQISTGILTFCDGTRVRLISTYRQSKAQGSPIQGFNAHWWARDEAQDQVDVHGDIESRGRAARGGGAHYKQLGTATAKDDSDWRTLRDVMLESGEWVRRELSIFRSPFVAPAFWQKKQRTMSSREFKRRYGDPETGKVSDLTPELAVYFEWVRERNLIVTPQIGAVDVTASVLSNYRSYLRPNAGFTLLAGHDPGNIYNTTELLRLLVIGNVPTWVVVGELQTKQTTAREHAEILKRKLQQEFGVDWDASRDNPTPSGGKCLIFCDPHGKGNTQTDYQTVYMAMQQAGLDVFSPAPQSGRIKRTARVGMLNRLLYHAPDSSHLVIGCDHLKTPAAPLLVRAFESLEKRAGDDNPEGTQRKDEDDQTHAPAAVSYALWPFEQEAFTANTLKTALAEARKARRV